MTPDDVREASRSPLWKRLGWFVLLWLAGVLAVSGIAYGIRLVLIG